MNNFNKLKLNNIYIKLHRSHEFPIKPTNTVLKADSGASKSFIRQQDEHILQNLNIKPGPIVALPDMSIFQATKSGSLPIPGLSKSAATAHVLPGLKSTSLLSLGQLCDDGCDIHLNKINITITKKFYIISIGIQMSC